MNSAKTTESVRMPSQVDPGNMYYEGVDASTGKSIFEAFG